MASIEELAASQVNDLMATRVLGYHRTSECAGLHAPDVVKCPTYGSIPDCAGNIKESMTAARAYAIKNKLNFELIFRVETGHFTARFFYADILTKSTGTDAVPSLAICWALLKAAGVEAK